LERRSRVLSDEERRLIAYHEAGHALVSLSVPGSDPLHKVTIIPRGRALGITAYLAEEELHKYTKQSILSRLAMAYGGRVADERAKAVRLERRDALDRLAAALLERETLDREEVEMVVAGKPLPPVPPPPPAPAAPSAEGTAREKTPAARGPVLGSPPPEPAGA